MDERTDRRIHAQINFIRSTLSKSRPNNVSVTSINFMHVKNAIYSTCYINHVSDKSSSDSSQFLL